MGKSNQSLADAGILLADEGLNPDIAAKRVRLTDRDKPVIDGPFTETKELIAGFWIWKVESTDQAVEWARRCPAPVSGKGSEPGIRRVFDARGLAEALKPELRDQNGPLRAELERQEGG